MNLGGDTAHDTSILNGTAEVAVYIDKATRCMRRTPNLEVTTLLLDAGR